MAWKPTLRQFQQAEVEGGHHKDAPHERFDPQASTFTSTQPDSLTIRLDDSILEGTESVADVYFVRPVASYSWDEDMRCPRLHIPGAPRCFDMRRADQAFAGEELKKDGVIIKDENHFRVREVHEGRFPTEPIFRTIRQHHIASEINLKSVDIVCDSSTLCKLIAWLQGKSSKVTVSERNWDDPDICASFASFAFDMDIIGDSTLVLTRVEDDDIVHPDENKPTYGPSFERLVTHLPESLHACCSFYRIHEVMIGGFVALVRCQLDAVDGNMLQHNDFISPSPWQCDQEGLEWKHSGCDAALKACALELKTISAKRRGGNWSWNEWHSQMLFRGASHVVVGFHKDGKVTREPTKIPFCDVKDKAKESCEAISSLGPLLLELQQHAQAGYSSVKCDGQPQSDLKISRALPKQFRVPSWVRDWWPYGGSYAASEGRATVSSSSDPSLVDAKVLPPQVSLRRLRVMMETGGLPSYGTISHFDEKPCCICMPHLRGDCSNGRRCHKCHHPDHTKQEASHSGGRYRQRAARYRYA